MTKQEKLDAFQAKIDNFINSNHSGDRRAWHMSGIARRYMILCDEFTSTDLDDLHVIALAAAPQLNTEFGARLTAINER